MVVGYAGGELVVLLVLMAMVLEEVQTVVWAVVLVEALVVD